MSIHSGLAPLTDDAQPAVVGATASVLPWRVNLGFLAAWVAVSFGGCYFARDLDAATGGWPLGYWWAAQGALVAFTLLLALHAALSNRAEQQAEGAALTPHPSLADGPHLGD